jgi:putative membrane protein
MEKKHKRVMAKPILVLCIDRDNDLYEKAKIHGPVIGREENFKAATALALADPEEPDANTIFQAIKTYDMLVKEKKEVEVITLTGHRKIGYQSDREISKQLNRILTEFPAESCIFISDGASDEEILPVIRSRLKIDAMKLVVMKQAKELEKTYFVILEKLKDPHYARIVFGIPAIFILLLAISSILGWEMKFVGVLLGLYFLVKGFGIEDALISWFRDFRFSMEKNSWIPYIPALVMLLLSVWTGHEAYMRALALGLDPVKNAAYTFKAVIFPVSMAILFILGGRSADAYAEKRKFAITAHAKTMVAMLLTALVLSVGAQWVLNIEPPYVGFGDFLFVMIYTTVLGYLATTVLEIIRKESLLGMKLDGKEVITDTGSFLGKVLGVDGKNETVVIQSHLGRKFTLPFRNITSIGENVLVRAA